MFFWGLLLVATGIGNILYVGIFLKSADSPYPIEILVTPILIFSGACLFAFLFELRAFQRWNGFYKRAKGAMQISSRSSTVFFIFFSVLALQVFPAIVGDLGQAKDNHSFRHFILNTKAFYIFSNLAFSIAFAFAAFEICISVLSTIKKH